MGKVFATALEMGADTLIKQQLHTTDPERLSFYQLGLEQGIALALTHPEEAAQLRAALIRDVTERAAGQGADWEAMTGATVEQMALMTRIYRALPPPDTNPTAWRDQLDAACREQGLHARGD